MKRGLEARLAILENSGLVIATLADFSLWHAHGCDSVARWDPHFKAQMEDLAKRWK